MEFKGEVKLARLNVVIGALTIPVVVSVLSMLCLCIYIPRLLVSYLLLI